MATATVTGQSPDQYDFSNPNTPVLGIVVYFETGAGNPGSIFVPQNRYRPDHVRQAIAAAAKLIDAVGALSVDY